MAKQRESKRTRTQLVHAGDAPCHWFGAAVTRRVVDALQYFAIGVSWGGFESLVWAPIITQEKRIPRARWAAEGVIPGLIRISCGLADVADLQDDLEQALRRL